MNNYIDRINIDLLKKAIEVEEKYKYINVSGRETTFSGFMVKQIKQLYKDSGKDIKWLSVMEAFERYPAENMLQRKKTIKRFIALILMEKKKESNQGVESNYDDEDIYYSDVIKLKGVGPKFGYLLNKLGIFSVYDLLSFYPKKYTDYSLRCPIRRLTIGEDVTVLGQITSVSSFTTKKNLTVLKVTVKDNTGSLELCYFYAKINKFAIERYKSQFPKGAGIILSGKVKFDNYSRKLTIDNPQHQIISEDNFESENLNLGRIVPI